MENIREVANDYLTNKLRTLARQERGLLVEFLGYIVEVERRQLHVELGFSTMFAFLRDYVGYDDASAFRRDHASRLMARFPMIAEYLGDGRLGLVTVVLLREVLEESNLQQILDRAAGRTKKEVEQLVAALRPKPVPADMIRKLPARTTVPEPEPAPAELDSTFTVKVESTPERRPTVEPINATEHVVRFTVGDAFLADLAAARDALSHMFPGADIATILHHGLHAVLEACEKRRLGKGGRSAGAPSPTGSRYIATGVRVEADRRDESRCAYVSPDGRRCASTYQLQFHHIDPQAKDGPATVDNISLRCRLHNVFHAVRDFGAEHVARAIAERQQALF